MHSPYGKVQNVDYHSILTFHNMKMVSNGKCYLKRRGFLKQFLTWKNILKLCRSWDMAQKNS